MIPLTFFYTRSLKPKVYFIFTTHFLLDRPHFKCSMWLVATMLDGAGLEEEGIHEWAWKAGIVRPDSDQLPR